MLQITTEVFMLKCYTFTFRVNALILTGSCECLCLWLCEWRIAGLIASPWHSNWGPENLVVKKTMFYFSANSPASRFWMFRSIFSIYLLTTSYFMEAQNNIVTLGMQHNSHDYFLSPFVLRFSYTSQRNYELIISSAWSNLFDLLCFRSVQIQSRRQWITSPLSCRNNANVMIVNYTIPSANAGSRKKLM